MVQFAIRNSKVIQAMNDTTPNHWSNESQYLLLILGRITLQYRKTGNTVEFHVENGR